MSCGEWPKQGIGITYILPIQFTTRFDYCTPLIVIPTVRDGHLLYWYHLKLKLYEQMTPVTNVNHLYCRHIVFLTFVVVVIIVNVHCAIIALLIYSWWMKHFPRYWPLVRGIRLSPVNSPHKGQWRGALMFFFLSAPEYTVERITRLTIWDTIVLIVTSL